MSGLAGSNEEIVSVNRRGVLAVALLVGSILGALCLGAFTYLTFDDIESQWSNVQDVQVKRLSALAELQQVLGYGGLIHDFKNWLLRGELTKFNEFYAEAQAAYVFVASLKETNTTKRSHEALDAIHGTIQRYEENARLIFGLRDQGASAEEIDALVRIDDGPAIRALQALRQDATDQLVAAQESANQDAKAFGQIILIGLVALCFPLAGIIASAPYMRRMIYDVHHRQAEVLKNVIESFPGGIGYFDTDDRLVFANSTYLDQPSNTATDLADTTFEALLRTRAANDLYDPKNETKEQLIQRRLAYRQDPNASMLMPLANGRWQDVHDYKTSDGGTATITFDVTETEELREKLIRSQRLEAVGKLTGGIAHDFNNMLHVISGNAQLLEMSLKSVLSENPAARRQLSKVMASVENGASLTKRLLAFSRQDSLSPEVTSVSSILLDLGDVLKHTLGEQIDLRAAAPGGMPLVYVDKHQLENAIINLAVNARDAMPEGGTLTIDASPLRLDGTFRLMGEEVAPGEYVMVSVTDTGTGMRKEIVDHVIEPFFTTKEVGKGSGLGLSMVFGFVQQSGGYMNIYSEPGEGTAVRLYLPVTASDAEVEKAQEDILPPVSTGRILLVEDDPDVREIPVAILEHEGIEVTAVGTAKEALLLLGDDSGTFDLLFTDIVLPGGMNGIELAKTATQLSPGLKVLYASGYTERFVNPEDGLKLGENLLRKPYQKRDLLKCVREAMETSIERKSDEYHRASCSKGQSIPATVDRHRR